jgi:hypothetical protein
VLVKSGMEGKGGKRGGVVWVDREVRRGEGGEES